MSRLIRPVLPLLSFAAALTLAGCGQGKPTTPPANANPPPAVVTVLRATLDPTPLTAELPGRTAAHLIAEVRPQVTGIIKERRFDEELRGPGRSTPLPDRPGALSSDARQRQGWPGPGRG